MLSRPEPEERRRRPADEVDAGLATFHQFDHREHLRPSDLLTVPSSRAEHNAVVYSCDTPR